MAVELLVRPDHGKRAYRLKCRFVIGAYPSERTLELGKFEAAERFVRDMRKQDYEYLDTHGLEMSGPFPATETVTIPKRSQQEQWHAPSAELFAAIQSGYRPERMAQDGGCARPVLPLAETDAWEFELSGVFVHKTIWTEVPDPHEEKEMPA